MSEIIVTRLIGGFLLAAGLGLISFVIWFHKHLISEAERKARNEVILNNILARLNSVDKAVNNAGAGEKTLREIAVDVDKRLAVVEHHLDITGASNANISEGCSGE